MILLLGKNKFIIIRFIGEVNLLSGNNKFYIFNFGHQFKQCILDPKNNVFNRDTTRCWGKLNLKRDKIVDIQKAMKSADINNDKQLDFDEWRQDLKTYVFFSLGENVFLGHKFKNDHRNMD